MSGLFDLLDGDHLCEKLDHDYKRLSENFADVYAAFDFIITAWHLLEWKYPGNSARSQRDTLCAQYPVLGLCEHLCVSGKHYQPTNPRLQSLQGSFRRSPWKRGVWASGVWANVWQDELVIELSGDAKVSLGDELTMEQFANLVMAFWRGPGGCQGGTDVPGTAM